MCENFRVIPQLDYMDFSDLYSVFCFDVSSQDLSLGVNGVTVTIHINKDNEFKARCVCVILEEKTIKMNLKGGRITSL